MSDNDFDNDNDQQDDDQTGDKPNWRRQLERKAAKADALARENAFLKAGVNPDDPKAKWLVKGYDGDLTPEAIKTAALEAGVLKAETGEARDEIPDEEKQAHERLADTTRGAGSGGERDFHAEMMAAETPAELDRIAREAGVRFADGAYTPPTHR